MRKDNACAAACGPYLNWNVLGWINLDPGETETRANPTSYRFFYHYAERADGAVYNGAYGPAEVSNNVFQKCQCLTGGAGWYSVGFRQLNTDRWGGVNYLQ
jgi:hypothetical protein